MAVISWLPLQNDIITSLSHSYSDEKWLDFCASAMAAKNSLSIKASTDFSYYHLFEIMVNSVSYNSCPEEWTVNPDDDWITVLSGEERSKRGCQLGLQKDQTVVQFVSDENEIFYCAGDAILINQDTVFYYQRENLKPGERLADWLLS